MKSVGKCGECCEGKLRSVSDAEIVQEEECREVRVRGS